MSYRWEPVRDARVSTDDLAAAGLCPTFETREAAEEWLGLFYDDLLAAGVTDVSLYEADRHVYGPMPLHP